MAGFVPAASVGSVRGEYSSEDTVQVTGREHTERRILERSMRPGGSPRSASLVRGSSRRITIVRFRPADIRVINRRNCLSPRRLPCGLAPQPSLTEKRKPPGLVFALYRVAPYHNLYFMPN